MSLPYISFDPTIVPPATAGTLTIGPALATALQITPDLEPSTADGPLFLGTAASTAAVTVGNPSTATNIDGGTIVFDNTMSIINSWTPYPLFGFCQFYGTATGQVIQPLVYPLTPSSATSVTFSGAVMTYPMYPSGGIAPFGGWPAYPLANGTYSWNEFFIRDPAGGEYEISWQVPVDSAGGSLGLYVIPASGPNYIAPGSTAGTASAGTITNRCLVKDPTQMLLVNTGTSNITISGGAGATFNLLIRRIN